MVIGLAIIFSSALLLSLLLFPATIAIAHRLNILDSPDPSTRGENHRAQKHHTAPVPRLGGLVMALSFTLSIWFSPIPTNLKLIASSSLIFFAIGFVDDLIGLNSKIRLVSQIATASILVVSQNFALRHICILNLAMELPDFVALPLSIFVIVGAINAFNMLDGVDGLAAGIGIISILMLTITHFLSSNDLSLLPVLSLAAIGCLIGFLKYNTHPAKIFMGDGGSYWLGSIVGFCIIVATGGFSLQDGQMSQNRHHIVDLVIVVSCVAIPAFDTLCVMIDRIFRGKSPFNAEHNHLHDSMRLIGLGQKRLVMLIYFLAIFAGFLGTIPLLIPNKAFIYIVGTGMLCLFIIIFALKNQTFTSKIRLIWSNRGTPREKHQNRVINHVSHLIGSFNKYLVYGIVAVTPLLGGRFPQEIGLLALFSLPIVVTFIFLPAKKEDFFQAFILVIAGSIILTAVNSNSLAIEFHGSVYRLQKLYNTMFVTLMSTSILYIILTFKDQYHYFSPTDFLLLCIPISLMVIPEPIRSEYRLGIISVRSMVLFVTLRSFLVGHQDALRRISILMVISLVYIALNGYFKMRIL